MSKRVAVVHDWLVTYAGAERVLEQILYLYPEADLFSVCDFLPEDQRSFLGGRTAQTSFIQRLPFARRRYRAYLPLMPLAIEQLDLSGYDLVISSSHAVAKGALTGPNQWHVSYVHSPIRYAWDLQHQYLREASLLRGPKSLAARAMLHYMRLWDVRTAHGVDQFVANSNFIARRISKIYGRVVPVVYPPVDTERFGLCEQKGDYYVTAARLVPYKRVPLIAEAFRCLDRRLLVIGDGPDRSLLERAAKGVSNIEVLGRQPDAKVVELMQRSRAFVFAAEEDFGIVMVEAQACGTPVIAYGSGGAGEIVQDGLTGTLFAEQTVDSIVDAVRRFEAGPAMDPRACRENAERFSIEMFRKNMTELLANAPAFRANVPNAGSQLKSSYLTT
ncbi:MAG TPA: glycosyltransferase family 4 protein [Trinickia sp.]|jgi:glycosyltransferase involved in cell wall biosynthesis|uniref:glycosyltransferase family 4 protein n=1 Tax=Trinickia sp. TaxID=2571163 RepID=UPI002C559BF4|nr:glycosyltransferase family 4 protein [Trinickia sp.]HTI18896.1 glycosyltransferase family 4 protein [Trinickia sp.]